MTDLEGLKKVWSVNRSLHPEKKTNFCEGILQIKYRLTALGKSSGNLASPHRHQPSYMSYNQPPCPSGNPRIFVHCIDIFPKPIVLTCCQVGQVEALFAEQDPKLGKKYSFIKVDDKRSHGFQIIWYSSDILMNQDCHIKIEELPPSLQQSQKDHVLFGVVRFIQFLPVHDAIQKHAFLVGVLRVQRNPTKRCASLPSIGTPCLHKHDPCQLLQSPRLCTFDVIP